MAPKLTKLQKLALATHLRALKKAHVTRLRSVADRAALATEQKVSKRLKKVSMTVRLVPILEVLNCERRKTPTIPEIREFAKKK